MIRAGRKAGRVCRIISSEPGSGGSGGSSSGSSYNYSTSSRCRSGFSSRSNSSSDRNRNTGQKNGAAAIQQQLGVMTPSCCWTTPDSRWASWSAAGDDGGPVSDSGVGGVKRGEIVMLDPSLPPPRYVPPKAKTLSREPMGLREALQLLMGRGVKERKFDETIEIVLNTNVDPRRGDQMVRGVASLPWGTGKTKVRVCVFCRGEDADAALQAGADIVGDDATISKILEQGGSGIDFDACLATPEMMPKLGRIARVLGPRGLMPNPKLGTVTTDVSAAVEAAKKGRVEFRVDKGAVIHAGVGKKSFSEDALVENIQALVDAALEARPKGLKGSGIPGYILTAFVTSTMGPSYPVSLSSFTNSTATL